MFLSMLDHALLRDELGMSEGVSTPVCGLNCDFCRLYMNDECKGCGVGKKASCNLIECCKDKGLAFCSLCSDFPCEKYNGSKCLHPDWVEELRKHPFN
jgi:hypothetical protein